MDPPPPNDGREDTGRRGRRERASAAAKRVERFLFGEPRVDNPVPPTIASELEPVPPLPPAGYGPGAAVPPARLPPSQHAMPPPLAPTPPRYRTSTNAAMPPPPLPRPLPRGTLNTGASLLQGQRYPYGRPLATPARFHPPRGVPPLPSHRVLRPGQLRTRQIMADYFRNFWWRGDSRPYDLGAREPVYSQLPIPVAPGFFHNREAVDLYRGPKETGRNMARHFRRKLKTGIPAFRSAEQGEEVTRLLHDKSRVLYKAGMKFKRLLGHGGFGLVALYRAENSAGRIQDVAAKFNMRTSNNTSFPKEKTHLQTLARAMHIVQMFSPGEFFGTLAPPQPDNPPTPRPLPKALATLHMDAVEADNEMLLLEYSKFGDFGKFLLQLEDDVPPKLLWYMWKCLLMGVIEMEYPPLKQAAHEHLRQRPGLQPEYDHRQPGDRPYSLVHFDLDFANVLVTEGDSGNHKLTPKLQIADFGLAETWPSSRAQMDVESAWCYRKRGKPRFYAPEQFAPEWDSVYRHPRDELPARCKHVAGNYGWKTNLYQVAHIMWILITRLEVHFPPTLTWDPAPGAQPPVPPTYGGHLLTPQYDHLDRNMRLTIARCMAHAPDDRPDMAWLLKDLEHNLERLNAASTPLSDQLLLAGCARYFTEPPSRRKGEPDFDPFRPFDPKDPQLNPKEDVQSSSAP